MLPLALVAYRVEFLPKAEKQLEKLDRQVAARLVTAAEKLADNPRPAGCKKLQGRAGYRIRVGDYRVIYEVNDSAVVVIVLELGHRREVYDR